MKNSIKKNYIYNLIYQILIIILPLVTTPYLSRVLESSGIGIYSYTLSIATYFVLFGSLGVAMYGQREIAYIRDNKEKTSKVFWEVLILRCITMSISLILFIVLFGNGNDYSTYYRILVIEIIANLVDVSWFFQGLEEFKKTVTRNIVVKLVSVLCIFAFVKNQQDLWIYILIYTLSNLLGNFSLWIYLPKYITKVSFKNLDIKKHILPTISLFIPQIAMQVYLVIDKTMLGNILGDMSEVGNYEQSQKIIKTALTIVTSLGTVVAPRIANTISKGQDTEVNKYLKQSFMFVWFLGFPIMLGLMAISQSLVPWFLGEGYDESVKLIMVGSLLVMAIGLNNVTGIQYLIPAKKQNLYTKSVVIAAILNFVLNLILIPHFRAMGALLASIIAEFSIVVTQLIDTRKVIDFKIIFKGSWKYIVSGIIMFIPTFIIGNILPHKISTTTIQLIVACIIYGIILIIIKDDFIYALVSKLKNKVLHKKGE